MDPKTFQTLFFGNKFEILSDHRPLQWAFRVKDPITRLLHRRLKIAEYDCLIKHVSSKDNILADALSRVQIITTRQKAKKIKPIEHRPFQTLTNIAVLSSPDKIAKNPFFMKLQFLISKPNEIEKCRPGNKNIYVTFYRESAKIHFNVSNFRFIMQTLKHLLIKNKVTEIGLYDDFNAVSKFRLSLIEKEITELLSPVQLAWATLGRVPINRHRFIRRQHEHLLTAHAGRDKMYELITNKGYYLLGLYEDIAGVIQNCDFAKNIKKIMYNEDNSCRLRIQQITPSRNVSHQDTLR